MLYELKRAAALGAKYGLRAIPMYTDASVETPEIDESGMEGAVGIVDFGKCNDHFQKRSYPGGCNNCFVYHSNCRR